MAEKCLAPDGSEMVTFGMSRDLRSMLLVLSIACVPLATVLLGPRLFFYVGRRFGDYLRAKTAGRRAQILQLTEDDEKEYLAQGGDRRSSDEWESVDAYTTGTAKNGEKADPEWDGFIGFFHPFW
jgi:alpha-1,2-mannosyltransferase